MKAMRLVLALVGVSLVACSAKGGTVWRAASEGEVVVFNDTLEIHPPQGWLLGEYGLDARGRMEFQGLGGPVGLLAATKEAWRLQRMVWRVVDGPACACQSLDCHQVRWQAAHGHDAGTKLLSVETVAVAGQAGVRLTWEQQGDDGAVTSQDVLFCVGPTPYQISYTAPSGFFYTRFESVAQRAIAATRLVKPKEPPS